MLRILGVMFIHHSSFIPNWIWRDVVAVEVITPAVGETPDVADEYTTVFGVPKLAWFRMLKNSARNCRRNRSEIAAFLSAEKSTVVRPGPINVSRPTLP